MPQNYFLQKPLNQDSIHPFNAYYRANEAACIETLLNYLNFDSTLENQIHDLAFDLVKNIRAKAKDMLPVEALMSHYDLSTEEGVMLMCLAEALLRIPDTATVDLLIQDKLTSAEWDTQVARSESSFVNITTWGLALSGKVLRPNPSAGFFGKIWHELIKRSGEPLIRQAVRQAMKVLSEQFILGRSIDEALKRAAPNMEKGFRYSFDMLGEVARTQYDADRYFKAYFDAISELGASQLNQDLIAGPSISVKLSALHPRYEYAQRDLMLPVLTARVKELALHAKNNNISLTIDAEEADRLDISLDIIRAIFIDPDFANWPGLGLALQAYQKRAFYVLDWLINLAREQNKKFQVRLVKGAYWDTEIKLAQVEAMPDYPVFTRKVNTDISYLACAKKMMSATDAIYPQFATHNAYSVAAILSMMGDKRSGFEFQQLQGMGAALHEQVVLDERIHVPCRVYAPVGSYEDLLPYLVRRLLENGANSSFVNRIADSKIDIEKIIENPIRAVRALAEIRNSKIPLPRDLYGKARVNSFGIDLSDLSVLIGLSHDMQVAASKKYHAAPFNHSVKNPRFSNNPADTATQVGEIENATAEQMLEALQKAKKAFPAWRLRSVDERAQLLRNIANLLEEKITEFMFLANKEAGKTWRDGIAEVREAVDFCRYYAEQAELQLNDHAMVGPTGETNILRMEGRGVFLCISPWNFPLAIFTGQVVAALVAGNCVIAKPSEQTLLIAALAVECFHKAGIPQDVVQLMPGRGSQISQTLVANPGINGILFTGSNETAEIIQKTLAERGGAIIPFVAETGGMNAMIADSTALPEQLVRDVLISAFGSAGQRCSALRILFVQEDIADKVIKMLAGAMAELRVANPQYLSTDIGPVIDEAALKNLQEHEQYLQHHAGAKLIYACQLSEGTQSGTYFAPQAWELESLSILTREVFGPMLHVIRYAQKDLDQVIEAVNGLNYGLTFGIQSRIASQVQHIQERVSAGNIYVNRNMIGAVVGVQPFGGGNLSGTGPKAGGPHYLARLCNEKTITVDTTAAGGNASLMAMMD